MEEKMKRLGKPRRKRKSIILTMKYVLDIHEDDPIETDKIGKLFRTWMRDHFSNWDQSILQYFLYENNIKQNATNDRVLLEGHLDKIIKDDTLHSKEDLDKMNEEIDSDSIDYSYKDTSSSESTRRPDLLEDK